MYLDYYNAPRPVSSRDLKINPLNEGDTSTFKGLFKNAIGMTQILPISMNTTNRMLVVINKHD